MNYVRQGYQEMAFNDDLDLEENIYVSKDGKLCTLYTQCAGEVFFNNIEIYEEKPDEAVLWVSKFGTCKPFPLFTGI